MRIELQQRAVELLTRILDGEASELGELSYPEELLEAWRKSQALVAVLSSLPDETRTALHKPYREALGQAAPFESEHPAIDLNRFWVELEELMEEIRRDRLLAGRAPSGTVSDPWVQ